MRRATAFHLFVISLLPIVQPRTTNIHKHTHTLSCTVHIFVISLIGTSVSQPCPHQTHWKKKPVLANIHLQPTVFSHHPLCSNKQLGAKNKKKEQSWREIHTSPFLWCHRSERDSLIVLHVCFIHFYHNWLYVSFPLVGNMVLCSSYMWLDWGQHGHWPQMETQQMSIMSALTNAVIKHVLSCNQLHQFDSTAMNTSS